MEFRLRKGFDIGLGQPPKDLLTERRPVRTVGLMARDFPGVVFDLRVTEDDQVRRGQVLCVDRHSPDIVFAAAAAGRVSRIHHGRRRRIEEVVVAAEGDDDTLVDPGAAERDGAALRSLLLKSGAWVAFRSRPFGRIPAPSERPSAIFVTATDTNPLAADPATILAPQLDAFRCGAEALMHLTDGPVFVCQPPGPSLAEPRERIHVARFSGPHPSGLAGTHVHHLWPVSQKRSVWQVGYQDVAAIGHLLTTGRTATQRTLSVAGPGLRESALVSAPLGVALADLLPEAGGGAGGDTPLAISGSILSGREAPFLGRYDVQVTMLDRDRRSGSARSMLQRLLDRLPRDRTGATMPTEAFERLFPLDLLPVPLMRALAVGDVETAERLGCLELLEEDLALLSWRCPSGSEYGALLRQTLDALEEERAA
ncbi:MAG: NADH:ubiquinone reductase (Na(+)-transporting) subunit A [Hyphomicrobiales bacterium]|nr:NADH:ubiquinone reductase (Na(+)-transporting) subunit A [Hyphomicrobiales bacterium]